MTTSPLSLYDATQEDIASLFPNEPKYRVGQIWQALYEKLKPVEAISNISAAMRQQLAEAFPVALELQT